ncbi:MAG: hypothetical protein WCJ54_04455 [Actinomycetota bacterium]
MLLENSTETTAKNIISSYEIRIKSIGSIFDTTHELLQSFKDSFLDSKQDREKSISQLRENLAKNESLRRNDFDSMMKDILIMQDRREKEVWGMLNGYLDGQKEMSQTLGKNFEEFKDSMIAGDSRRLEEFKDTMKNIMDRQTERKEEVVAKLKEFQREREEMSVELKTLFEGGRNIRIADVKSMIKRFKKQENERLTLQKDRKAGISKKLSDFRKERLEAAMYWKNSEKKIAKTRRKPADTTGL